MAALSPGSSLVQGDFMDGVVDSMMSGLISQLKTEYQREFQKELQAALEGVPLQHHPPGARLRAEAGEAREAAAAPPRALQPEQACGAQPAELPRPPPPSPQPPAPGPPAPAAGAERPLPPKLRAAAAAGDEEATRSGSLEGEPVPWLVLSARAEPPAPPGGQGQGGHREDAHGARPPAPPGVPDAADPEEAPRPRRGTGMTSRRLVAGDADPEAKCKSLLRSHSARAGTLSLLSESYASTSSVPVEPLRAQSTRSKRGNASEMSRGPEGKKLVLRNTNSSSGSDDLGGHRVERLSREEEYALKIMREETEKKERAARDMFSHAERSRQSVFFANNEGVVNEWRRAAFKIVANPKFDFALGIIIVSNAVTIGLESTFSRRGEPLPLWLHLCEYSVLVVYICELVFRLYALGPSEAFQSNWIRFDAVLVASGVMNLLIHLTAAQGAMGKVMDNINMLKMVRLFRLARVVRLLTQFRTLWMLVQGLMTSVMPMIWTSLIMLVVVYVFAVAGMELITADAHSPEQYTEATLRFDDIFSAMMTLIQFITLDSISAVYRPIADYNPWLSIFFLVFLLIGPIALMNVITAIQVEALFRTAGEDHEAKKAWERMKRKTMTPKLRSIFMALDADESGEVDLDELMNAPDDVKESLTRIVDLDQMEEIFRMLDFDGSGAIDIDEFVDGIMRSQQDKPTELVLLLKLSNAILDHLMTKDGGLQRGQLAECKARRRSSGRRSSGFEDADAANRRSLEFLEGVHVPVTVTSPRRGPAA